MAERPSRARLEPWPWIVAGLLGSTVAVCLAFAHVAASHPDALVVEDAYTAGLAHNDAARARAAADEAGWRFDLAVEPTPAGVRARLVVLDAEGAPLAADALVLRRERPSEGGYDADFPVDAGAEIEIPLPRPGRWHLVARARVGGAVLERVYGVERSAAP